MFLGFSCLHSHERVQLVEVSVDVSVFPPEKFLNPDRGEFVTEEDNISDLRDGSLLFPCYSWSSPGVLLSPERIEEVQDDFPTGELMLDRNIRVD